MGALKTYCVHMRRNVGLMTFVGYPVLSQIVVLVVLNALAFLVQDAIRFSPLWLIVCICAWSVANSLVFRESLTPERIAYLEYLDMGVGSWLLLHIGLMTPSVLLEAFLTTTILDCADCRRVVVFLLFAGITAFAGAGLFVFIRMKRLEGMRWAIVPVPSNRLMALAFLLAKGARIHLVFFAVPCVWAAVFAANRLEIPLGILYQLFVGWLTTFVVSIVQYEQRANLKHLWRRLDVTVGESALAKIIVYSVLVVVALLPPVIPLGSKPLALALLVILNAVLVGTAVSVFLTRWSEGAPVHDFLAFFLLPVCCIPILPIGLVAYRAKIGFIFRRFGKELHA